MHLIVAILRGPFWLHFAIAVALIWMGISTQSSTTARLRAETALLQQPAPATIPIADLVPPESWSPATEVSVTAQVALSHSTRLIQRTNFITTDEDLMYVLVDPDAPSGTTVARAVIVVEPGQAELVTEWMLANATGYGSDGPIVDVTGLLEYGPEAHMVFDALQDQDMVKAPNFFYIKPHFKGRTAALTHPPQSAILGVWEFFAAAAFFALLGALRFRRTTAPPLPVARPAAQGSNLTGLTGVEIAQRLIDEDIARARAGAAMASPKPATDPPKPEVFTVPDPVYVPRTPGSPVKEVPPLGLRIHTVFRTALSPKVLGYTAFMIALLITIDISFKGTLTISLFQLNGTPGQALGTILAWIVAVGALLIILKGFVWVPPTSARKSVYDPYLRLAERERQGRHD
ncbi:MAG: hypothetical protein ACRC6I_06860 [Paracoccaceae bacterium]